MEYKNYDEMYEALTDEQKKAVETSRTPQELIDRLGKLGAELPDVILDAVTGGLDDTADYECTHTIFWPGWTTTCPMRYYGPKEDRYDRAHWHISNFGPWYTCTCGFTWNAA